MRSFKGRIFYLARRSVMKKRDLGKLAIIGIASGLFMTPTLQGQEKETSAGKADEYEEDPNSENEGYYLMSEQELFLNLNRKGRELYESLSPEGKKLALKVASRRCNGANECKGLNACKTEDNDCAGKGECKGTTKCAIGDKNLAVKLVAKKMAEKREKTQTD